MDGSYDDYNREYNAYLSRIRSFLATSSRNQTTLTECQRLLQEAKKCATAMQALAEVEGNAMRVTEARNLVERDITPLATEVQRQLQQRQRQELFYQAPDIESAGRSSDMDALIQSSDDLLRESQSILTETEEIGTITLQQMGRQREQLENSNRHLEAVRTATIQAKHILQRLSWKAWTNRIGLHLMIAVLGAANLFVLYRIYKKHHDKIHEHDGDDQDNPGGRF